MKYAGIIENDVVNGVDVCVSFWCQGCPKHCVGCHNPQTWDFDGGIEVAYDTVESKIIKSISKNNVMRNFAILGGEPLCEKNITLTKTLMRRVRLAYPDIIILIWTGYEMDDWRIADSESILDLADYIIDGPYIHEQRDLTLKWRGSTNQHIWHKVNGKWICEE